ncbi:YncE family protein [Actinoplanes sp. CA-030573]|uniref:YncE family protein n=1 Tax=Actinoplanes sp. CA-030573 TaxID=3239898 RepID=UPI003D8DD140
MNRNSGTNGSGSVVIRRWLLNEIADWASRPDSPVLILVGKAGMGKSIVCRQWIEESAAADLDSPLAGTLLAAYRCDHFSAATHSPFAFIDELTAQALQHEDFRMAADRTARKQLRDGGIHVSGQTIVGQNLGTAVGVQIQSLAMQSPLRSLQLRLLEPLAEVSRPRKPIILVDGLDEISYWNGVDSIQQLVWSGAFEAAGARLAVATRSVTQLGALPPGSVVIDLESRRDQCIRDVAAYVDLLIHSRPDWSAVPAARVADESRGNFLCAKFLLDAPAAGWSNGSGQTDGVDLYSVYEQHLRLWSASRDPGVKQQWRQLVRPLLGALGAAQAPGLTATQLAGVLGTSLMDVVDALDDAGTLLDRSGSGDAARWTLFHSSLGDFLSSKYASLIAESHLAIGVSMTRNWTDEWERCDDQYAREQTAWHLMQAALQSPSRELRRSAVQALSETVTDPTFVVGAPQTVIHDLLTTGAADLGLSRDAVDMFSLLRRSYPSLDDSQKSDRAFHLALVAHQLNLTTIAQQLGRLATKSPTLPLWADWRPESDYDLLLDLGEPIVHLSALDENRLVVVGRSQLLTLDLPSRKIIATIPIGEDTSCVADALSEDGKTLVAVGTEQGVVYLIDLGIGRVIHRLRQHGDGGVTSVKLLRRPGEAGQFDVAVSAVGVTAYADLQNGVASLRTPEGAGGALQLWDCATGLLVEELVPGRAESCYLFDVLVADGTYVGLCTSDRAFLDDNADNFLTRLGSETSLQIWNLRENTSQPVNLPAEINIGVFGLLDGSASGRSVLVSFHDATRSEDFWEHMVGVFDIGSETLTVLGSVETDTLNRRGVKFDRALNVYYSLSNDRLCLHDLSNGTLISATAGFDSRITRTGWMPGTNPHHMFGAVEGEVRLWTVRPGVFAEVGDDSTAAGRLCVLSEQELVVSMRSHVALYDLSSGESRRLFQHDYNGRSITSDSLGAARVLDVDSFHNLRIADIDSGEVLVYRQDSPWRLNDGSTALLVGRSAFHFHRSKEGDVGVDVWDESGFRTVELFSVNRFITTLSATFFEQAIWLGLAVQGGAISVVRWDLADGTIREVHRFEGSGAVMTLGVELRLVNLDDRIILATSGNDARSPITLHVLDSEGLVSTTSTPWNGDLLDVGMVNRVPWILAADKSGILLGSVDSGPELRLDVGARVSDARWVHNKVAISTSRGLLCLRVPWKASYPWLRQNVLRRRGLL